MKINKKHLMLFCTTVIMVSIIFAVIDSSSADSGLKASHGETKYVKVKAIEEKLLITSEGSFVVSKETIVHDEYGKLMSFAEIKTSSFVRIFYNRVNGQLMAEDIIVRKSSTMPLPE